MKQLAILILLFLTACKTDLVEPKEVNLTGYWQNAKNEILDGVNYRFFPVALNVLQDAQGYTTLVGQITTDFGVFDISGSGVTDIVTKSFSWNFTTNETQFSPKLTGQFNGNVLDEMLRGQMRINAMYFVCVVHLKRTAPIIYLPKLSPHNQGGGE